MMHEYVLVSPLTKKRGGGGGPTLKKKPLHKTPLHLSYVEDV